MKNILLITGVILLVGCGAEVSTDINTEDITKVDDTLTTNKSVDSVIVEEETPSNYSCEYDLLSKLDNDYSQTAPVNMAGVYDSIWVVGDDSVYGFSVKIWKVDDTYIGFMNRYYGGPEPYQSGPMVFGKETEEGNLNFQFYLKLSKGYSDWQLSSPLIIDFTGNFDGESLVGTIVNQDCETSASDEGLRKTLNLQASGDGIENYDNIQAWKTAFEYELNMTD